MNKVWVAIQRAYSSAIVFAVYRDEQAALSHLNTISGLTHTEIEELSQYGTSHTKRYTFTFENTTIELMDYNIEGVYQP